MIVKRVNEYNDMNEKDNFIELEKFFSLENEEKQFISSQQQIYSGSKIHVIPFNCSG